VRLILGFRCRGRRILCVIGFFEGLVDRLFELPAGLNIIPGLAHLNYAVPVENDVSREFMNVKERLHRSWQVYVFGPDHLLCCNEHFPFIFFGVRAHSYDLKRPIRKFLLEANERRDRFAARRTPGSPEVEQHNFPAKR